MKRSNLISILGLSIALALSGCAKKPAAKTDKKSAKKTTVQKKVPAKKVMEKMLLGTWYSVKVVNKIQEVRTFDKKGNFEISYMNSEGKTVTKETSSKGTYKIVKKVSIPFEANSKKDTKKSKTESIQGFKLHLTFVSKNSGSIYIAMQEKKKTQLLYVAQKITKNKKVTFKIRESDFLRTFVKADNFKSAKSSIKQYTDMLKKRSKEGARSKKGEIRKNKENNRSDKAKKASKEKSKQRKKQAKKKPAKKAAKKASKESS